MTDLNHQDKEINKHLEIDVPTWIDQDITVSQVEGIIQGGCASGAYMPAVTYYKALKIMGEHGDNVLQYIENTVGELPDLAYENTSWSGMACFYLSYAVELWASGLESQISESQQETKI